MPQIDLDRLTVFVNSLFSTTAYFLFQLEDIEAATMKYEDLSKILRVLRKNNIIYSLDKDVVRLGDILIALENNQQINKQKLKQQQKKFTFSGGLRKI